MCTTVVPFLCFSAAEWKLEGQRRTIKIKIAQHNEIDHIRASERAKGMDRESG